MSAFLVAVAMGWVVAAADPGQDATRFLEQCRDGKYEDAVKQFDSTVGKLMPADKMKTTWDTLIGQFGALKALGPARVEQAGEYTRVRILCTFERAPLDASVAYNAKGGIAGFTFMPVASDVGKEDPPYADKSKYEEEPITVGAKDWPLKGTITRPKGATAAPLVVLVHGSGPHDENEAIGPNAPFRDLAHGLASRGVAVLRYEKRTHAYGPKLKSMPFDTVSIDTEVIDDALAAIAKGRTLKGVDPKRVYLLGHSLGGSAGPETAKRDGKLAGLILLAAANRQPDTIVLEQLQYIADNDTSQAQGAKAEREKLKAGFARIRSGDAKPEEMVMGASVFYWKSWMGLKPAATAAELKDLPILVLRGEKDYQVNKADYEAFQAALKGRPNVVFHLYPGFSHLFQPGKGLPADYLKKGFMDESVINDIAKWIKTGK